MKYNKGIAPILIVLIIIGVLIIGGGVYYFVVKKTPKLVACTEEAKICPDGSTVSRTGPNCEFAECPTVKPDETADWKTYRNEEYGFEMKYPKEWYYSPAPYLLEEPVKSDVAFSSYPFSEQQKKENDCQVEIKVINAPLNKVLDDDVKAWGPLQFEDTTLDSIKGVTYTIKGGWAEGKSATVVAIPKDNYVYGFFLVPSNEATKKIFNQILSTFNFLE